MAIDPWSRDTDDEFEVTSFIKRLEDMIDDGGYGKSENFLADVLETVRHSRRVSERQRTAVDDIEERVRGRG